MAILAVSRQYGSGGREVGLAIAESMNYEYLDKEKIFQDIKNTGYKWEQWAGELDEHNPSVWERYDWSFRGFGALIQSTILNHSLRDRIVIMGRGGGFILKGIAHALRIRVVAPVEARIARITSRDAVDLETAHWLLEKIDRERTGFIQALYGKGIDDPAEYDIAFDSSQTTIEDIVRQVEHLLKQKDALKGEASEKDLQMCAAAAAIKAGLLTDPAFFSMTTLDVEYDGTSVVLRGIVRNPKDHKRVEEAARRLAQCEPFRCELRYRA